MFAFSVRLDPQDFRMTVGNSRRGCGLTREELEPLVAEGLTIERIAQRVGVSDSTAKKWLRRHGLQTRGAKRRAALATVRRTGERDVLAECFLCGYAKHSVALQFHHVEPSTKSFGLSVRGITRSIAKLREEAEKCVLLCANCHSEVEAGVVELPVKSG
jgi:transcriptional regulator with XRE-family HTH domain